MASSRHLITSNLVTKYVFRFSATIVSVSRFLSITSRRSYATMPIGDSYDQSWPRILSPKISSMSISMKVTAEERRLLQLFTPQLVDFMNYEGLCVTMDMPTGPKMEDIRLITQGKTRNEGHDLAGMRLLDKFTSNDINEEMKDDIMANIITNFVASFRDFTVENSWAYYDMFFDRSILGKIFCPVIGMLSPVNSFSIFKEETAESLFISIIMPGKEKMKLTTQGLRVSLDMDGPTREDVKTYFDYDTFFIEGKTKNKHYITGIRLPEGVQKKHNMIRKEKKDKVLYAFARVKTEELHDQMKPKSYITN